MTIGAIAGGAGAAAAAGVAVSRGGSDSSVQPPSTPTRSITFVTANPPPGSTVPVQPDGSIDLTLTSPPSRLSVRLIYSAAHVALDVSLVSRQLLLMILLFVRARVSTFRTRRHLAGQNRMHFNSTVWIAPFRVEGAVRLFREKAHVVVLDCAIRGFLPVGPYHAMSERHAVVSRVQFADQPDLVDLPGAIEIDGVDDLEVLVGADQLARHPAVTFRPRSFSRKADVEAVDTLG